MGEMQPKKCEGRELTKDQLAEHWGLHAGMPADSCRATEAGGKACSGRNPMSLRNYPCDNLIEVFFGAEQAELDEVGTFVFQKQLWQCMISQALNIKSAIEEWRSANVLGLLVWQLNEIWPTYVLIKTAILSRFARCLSR